MKYKKIIDIIKNDFAEYVTGIIDFQRIDLYTIIQNITPEYRLFVFSKICSKLEMEDYCEGLKYAYTKTTGINSKNVKLSLKDVLELFEKADKKLLMKADYNKWESFNEEIIIYRGTAEGCNNEAISWTIDKMRAIWFYKKYDSKGTVFKAKVRKEDIVCYFDETACNEKEVIINYNNIFSIEKLTSEEIDKEYDFSCFNKENMVINTDYVVYWTESIIEVLKKLGVNPNRELIGEIIKTFETKKVYKSKYLIKFPIGIEVELYEFISNVIK